MQGENDIKAQGKIKTKRERKKKKEKRHSDRERGGVSTEKNL